MTTINLKGALSLTLKNNELKVTLASVIDEIDPKLILLVNKEVQVKIEDNQTEIGEFWNENNPHTQR